MWYSDERYAMIEDSREKKSTAASAFKQRTHCGKSGGIKFPSDYMSAKELKSMNSECVSYRMNDPIKWEEFKTWPEEHQKSYISRLREKFKIPNTALAKAMGVEEYTLQRYIKCLCLNQGKDTGAAGRYWYESDDAVRFNAWWNGEEISEVKETPDLRKPMLWSQFKDLTTEQKIEYITWIRDYFGAPDKHIAETLFRVNPLTVRKLFTELSLNSGANSVVRGAKKWNKESFIAWCGQNKKVVEEGPVTKVETPVVDIFELVNKPEETPDEEVNPVEKAFQEAVERVDAAEKMLTETPSEPVNPPILVCNHRLPVIPKRGSMTFECNSADDVLDTIKTMLAGVKVNITVTWECVFEDDCMED